MSRLACVGLLYRKTLRISKQAMSRVTTGHVSNLISTDVERFTICIPFTFFFIVSLGNLIAMVVT